MRFNNPRRFERVRRFLAKSSLVEPFFSSKSCPSHLILATSTSSAAASGHRRRRSSTAKTLPNLHLHEQPSDNNGYGSRSTSSTFGEFLPAIPGTPADPNMSLSRSPSPQRGGGWSSPGLTTPYNGSSGRSSPLRKDANGGSSSVTWASAQARSAEVKGYPYFQPRHQGFFSRHLRRISSTLPHMAYTEKDKPGRVGWRPNPNTKIGRFLGWVGMIAWRFRLRLLIAGAFLIGIVIFYLTRKLFINPFSSCGY